MLYRFDFRDFSVGPAIFCLKVLLFKCCFLFLSSQLLVKGTVFARMSPDQKAQLVTALMDIGYYTDNDMVLDLFIFWLCTSFASYMLREFGLVYKM